MGQENLTEEMYKVKELGLKLVEFAYAYQYANMGDMNEVEQFEDTIKEELVNIIKSIRTALHKKNQ